MKDIKNIHLEDLEDKNFLKTINPDGIERSAFTHYLHNSQNGEPSSYKNGAICFVKNYLNFLQPVEKINLQVAENALQYLINFKDDKIPFPECENPVIKE
jgi:DNA (cytosine-5)-methyltransferase 1